MKTTEIPILRFLQESKQFYGGCTAIGNSDHPLSEECNTTLGIRVFDPR